MLQRVCKGAPDSPDLLLVVEVDIGRLEPLPKVVQVAVAAEGVALEVELLGAAVKDLYINYDYLLSFTISIS